MSDNNQQQLLPKPDVTAAKGFAWFLGIACVALFVVAAFVAPAQAKEARINSAANAMYSSILGYDWEPIESAWPTIGIVCWVLFAVCGLGFIVTTIVISAKTTPKVVVRPSGEEEGR
jgi:hypothetical protein